MKTITRFMGAMAGGLWLWSTAAMAQDAPPAEPAGEVQLSASSDYLLGLSLGSSLDHVGGDGRDQTWRPMWAFQWGRWRFATGGAAALLSLGRDKVDSGVSTSLLKDDHWSLSGSLHWDEGRDADAPLLQGLPEVRSTLRGRLSLGYRFTPRWSAGLSASQDLLGHQGGGVLNASLKYHHPMTKSTYWDVGLGAQWGGSTYMQTHYGISPQAALSAGRAAFNAPAGWERMGVSWGMASALNERWVAFGGVNWSGLTGSARRSPLVAHPDVWGANLGLAYRCCQ